MSEPSNHFHGLSNYHGNTHNRATAENKRVQAVAAALSILEAHAAGGNGSTSTGVSVYKNEVGPLADAIQAALEVE